MSVFVLDASVAIAWLLNEDAGGQADLALTLLVDEDALVPQLWHLEVRNGLLSAIRRGRIEVDAASERLRALYLLPIGTDAEADPDIAFDLARRHALTIYDAIYLELSERHTAPLATLDKALAKAAAGFGLPLVCDLGIL